MVLSQREKYIAVGVAGAVCLFLLYQFVFNPLLNWTDALSNSRMQANTQRDTDAKLFKSERELRGVWKDITAGGLKSDPAEAESQVDHALSQWAQESGVNLILVRSEQRPAEKNGFVPIGFLATGTGSSGTVSKLLWQIESAKIPLRIDDLEIHSRAEGSDDLSLTLKLSTLSGSANVDQPVETGARVVSAAPVREEGS